MDRISDRASGLGDSEGASDPCRTAGSRTEYYRGAGAGRTEIDVAI